MRLGERRGQLPAIPTAGSGLFPEAGRDFPGLQTQREAAPLQHRQLSQAAFLAG